MEEPSEEDCCHNGCSPCVFDVYRQNLLKRIKYEVGIRYDLLSQTKYKPFLLVKTLTIGDLIRIYRFQASVKDRKDLLGRLPYKAGQHLVLTTKRVLGVNNIEAEEDTVSREYSIISDSSKETDCCFEVVVKLYKHGKMSKFLDQLQEGATTLWRGPYGNFSYSPNSHSNIVMIAMGTGIAPLFSVARNIVLNEVDDTMISLLYCVRNTTEIVLREELNVLMAFWNFKCTYYFSQPVDKIVLFNLEHSVSNRLSHDMLHQECKKMNSDSLYLICGSQEFCRSIELCLTDFCFIDKKYIFIF